MKIGFIGLGSMGLPMARNLLRAGHTLAVYNRTAARAQELRPEGVRVASSPAEAATDADLVITMLSDDTAVAAVIWGPDGALLGLQPGGVHVSMSTISPAFSRRLADAHRQARQGYVAAPVFGRPEAAVAAKLWILAAGTAADIQRCRPALQVMGQEVIETGEDVTSANVIKIAGNLLLAAAIEAMGETFALVRKHGVDPARLLEIVNDRVIRSPIYANYGSLIAQGRYEPAGFKLKHGLKDTRLALSTADEVAAPMPLASLVHDHYLSALARGWGDLDWAALGRICAEAAGLDGPAG